MNYYLRFLILILLLLILSVLNLVFGTVKIPMSELWNCFFEVENCQKIYYNIVFQLRLPALCMSILAGSGLALAGLLMQTFFKNPIAGPYVLGVSAGASLGVAVVLIAAPQFLSYFGAWGQAGAAALGAAMVLIFILILSFRVSDNSTILIIGLMLSSGISAIVEMLQFWASESQLQRFISWTMSGVQAANWLEVNTLFIILLICLVLSFAQAKNLNLLLLGEIYARSLGLNYEKTRLFLFLITALLAGAICAFCGTIAFVGMGVPPLARWWFRTASHYILIWAVLLIGANILLFCQFLSVLPLENQTLPLNAVTSLFGLPLIVYFVYKNQVR
jgi:iron complex transport system permease protein